METLGIVILLLGFYSGWLSYGFWIEYKYKRMIRDFDEIDFNKIVTGSIKASSITSGTITTKDIYAKTLDASKITTYRLPDYMIIEFSRWLEDEGLLHGRMSHDDQRTHEQLVEDFLEERDS